MDPRQADPYRTSRVIVVLTLPRLLPQMERAVVRSVPVSVGQLVAPGSKLLEVRVDLSSALAHDCPPVSDYRVILSEQLWLRQVLVSPDTQVEVGQLLAVMTDQPDAPLTDGPKRPARVAVLSYVAAPDWWTDGQDAP